MGSLATVTVRGTGGAGTGGGHIGVFLNGTNGQITSGGGAISVTAVRGAPGSHVALNFLNGGQIVATTGTPTVIVTADSMNLASTTSIDAGANTVVLRPLTNGTPINVGGGDVTSGSPTLGLTDAELDRVTAGTLVLGSASSGNVTVSAIITRPASTAVQLTSGANVVVSGGQFDTGGGTLLLTPGTPGSVQPTRSGSDATASTASFANGSDLTINITGTTVDSGYNQLNVSGTVDLTGVDLVLTGSFTPALGNSFTIVSATSVTGTFTGLADGATLTFNGRTLQVAYTATAVTLTDVTRTLSAALSGGTLTVTDTANLANSLTVVRSGNDLVITDATERFQVAPAGGTLSNNNQTLTIPLASVTGSLTISAAGADDAVTVDLSGGNPFPAGGISVDGGSQTTSDIVTITGGAEGNVTYGYTSATGGSVAMTNFGTLTFGNTEALTNSGSSTDVAFNLPAGPSTVTLADDGTTGNTLSRLSATTLLRTDFANPSGNVSINRGNAADTLTVNALPDFNAGLAIGSAGAEFASTTFTGAVTLASGKHLSVDTTGTISLNSANSDLATAGAGTVRLTTARDLRVLTNASITTVDGDLTLSANQQTTPTSGAFIGVNVAGPVQATGTGNVTVRGRGGVATNLGNYGVSLGMSGVIRASGGVVLVEGTGGGTGASTFNPGVALFSNSEIGNLGTGSGATVTVRGFGGNPTSTATGITTNYGVFVRDASRITSSGGPVLVEGTGGGAGIGGANYGIYVTLGGAITSTGAGSSATVTVRGTGNGTGSSHHGVLVDDTSSRISSGGGAISVTATGSSTSTDLVLRSGGQVVATAGSPIVTLTADTMDLASATAVDAGGNTVILTPRNAGVAVNLGGADVTNATPRTLGLTDAELDRVSAGTLVLGSATAGDVTVSADVTRAASTPVQILSGASVVISGGQVDTGGGTLLLHPGAAPAAVKPTRAGTDATASTVSFASDLAIAINGTATDTGYDQLNVAGAVDLTGVDLVLSGSYTSVRGESFTVVSATTVTGTFNGLANGATLTFNGRTLQVAYTGTSVTLTDITGTLSAVLSGGNLTVTDTTNVANSLTVVRSGSDLVITDATQPFILPTVGTLSNNNQTLTIPLASVTGSLSISTAGADDAVTVDLSGGNPFPAGGISVNGGTQTTSDTVTITGGAEGNVTYGYTSAIGGSVAMTNFGTLTYGNTEALTNSGSSTDVTFNLPTGPSTATFADDGTSSNSLSRLSATTLVRTDFANPSGNVSINRGNAADTLTVNALPDFNAGLAIGSAGAEFASTTFTGAVTLASDKNLSVNATGTINLSTASSDLATTGTGTLRLTTARDITLASGASVTTVDGDLTLSANQQTTPTAAAFTGIQATSAILEATGTGAVTVRGRGGEVVAASLRGVSLNSTSILRGNGGPVLVEGTGGGSGLAWGVEVSGASKVLNNGTGAGATVTIRGFGGTSGSDTDNYAVLVIDAGSQIAASGGAVLVEGTGGGSGTSRANHGVYVINGGSIGNFGSGSDATVTVTGTGGTGSMGGNLGVRLFGAGAQITSGGGAILVTGTGGSGPSSFGIFTLNGGQITGTTGTPTVTLVADTMNLSSITSVDAGANTVVLRPRTAGTVVSLGGADLPEGNPQTLGLTDTELDSVRAGTLTVGSAVAGTITVSDGISRTSATALNLTTGANIAFTAGSLDPAGGNVTLTTGAMGAITSGTATTDVSAGAGTITLTGGVGGTGAVGNPMMVSGSGLTSSTLGNAHQYLATLSTIAIAPAGLVAGSGTIQLAGGTFALGGSNRISDASDVELTGGATLALGSSTETIDQLVLTDGVITGSGALTGTSTFDLRKGTVSAPLAGSVGLTKSTADTVTLLGASTYTGPTTLSGGSLLVNGSTAAASAATVGSGTLGGSGTVGGALTAAGGTVAPGASTGILRTGAFSLPAGSTFAVEINGTTVGTGYDQLSVTGSVTLGGTLNITGTYTPAPTDTFVLLANDGTDPVSGTFAGLIEGAMVSVNGTALRLTYAGGDGNDVALTGTVSPPPPPPPGVLRYDFGSTATPADTANGYVRVANNSFYSTAAGYGWTSSGVLAKDTGTAPADSTLGSNALLRDANYYSRDRTFRANVAPDKTYQVTLLSGDATRIHDRIQVDLEPGTTPTYEINLLTGLDYLTAAANTWAVGRYVVTASTDGVLDLTFHDGGGSDPNWHVNALEIRPYDPSANAVSVLDLQRTASTDGAAASGYGVGSFTTVAADGLTVDTYVGRGALPFAMVTLSSTNFANPSPFTAGTLLGTDASAAAVGFQVQANDQGEFSFQLRRPSGTNPATLRAAEWGGRAYGERMQEYAVADARRFDFNAAGSPTATGFLGVLATDTYSGATGFGWTGDRFGVDRTTAPGRTNVDLYRDSVQGTDATFRVQVVPNTPYQVRLYFYDAGVAHDTISASVEGATAPLEVASLAASVAQVVTTTGTSTDGILDIRVAGLGGVDPNFALAGLDVWASSDPGEENQLSAGGVVTNRGVPTLTAAQLRPLHAEALRRFALAGASVAELALLQKVQFRIEDLDARGALGLAGLGTPAVRLDDNANGHGWFVDNTPWDDREFRTVVAPAERRATTGRAAQGVDLLTVVMHELAHVLGDESVSAALLPHGLATETLGVGTRRVPTTHDGAWVWAADELFARMGGS